MPFFAPMKVKQSKLECFIHWQVFSVPERLGARPSADAKELAYFAALPLTIFFFRF
jgi:hypothetical protein